MHPTIVVALGLWDVAFSPGGPVNPSRYVLIMLGFMKPRCPNWLVFLPTISHAHTCCPLIRGVQCCWPFLDMSYIRY